jgi:competence protein ComEC
LIVVCLFAFGIGILVLSSFSFRGGKEVLRVSFFDIGQGDSLLIESPTGVEVLIDGGPDSTVLRRLGDELGFFDRSIDVVLATHPDKDHVGGLPDVLERYKVDTVVMTENEGESSDADAFRLYAQ